MLVLGRTEGYLTAFSSYSDESGTNRESPFLVVAGFLATPDRWDSFATAWSVALRDFDVQFFHMSQFLARKGPFANWTDAQCDERFGRLLDIILAHTAGSVGVAISKEAFAAAMPDFLGEYLGGPLGMAGWMCMVESAGLLRKRVGIAGDLTINHIFARGAKGIGKVLHAWDFETHRAGRPEELCLGTVTLGTMREQSPLQAADVLAWELHNQAKQTSQDISTEVRESLRQLRAQPTAWCRYVEESFGPAWVLRAALLYDNEVLGPRPVKPAPHAWSSPNRD